MFKKMLVVALFGLMTASAAYAAPDRTGKWDAGVSMAAAIPTDGDLDTAFQVGGTFAYGVNEWFAIGFSGAWQQQTVDAETVGTVSISEYDITGVPLFCDLIARFPTGDQQFNPYGVLGLGTVIWSVDDATATSGGSVLTAQTDVDTDFALKLGGGVDWFINQNWIINFEAAYVFSSPSADVTVSGVTVSDDVDLDYWTVGGGVKYLFS
ncbi:MAG TPA: OmpW family outer membrane protein [Candidatus Eisenbacteria bacterium]|nr:OmpW family outer membrane protein [Candidatus Eisenbacteria bacterium]